MVKIIREVAVIGVSSIASLSDEDPHAPALVPAEGTAVDASRHDHQHGFDCPISAGEPAVLRNGMLYIDSTDSNKLKYVESAA